MGKDTESKIPQTEAAKRKRAQNDIDNYIGLYSAGMYEYQSDGVHEELASTVSDRLFIVFDRDVQKVCNQLEIIASRLVQNALSSGLLGGGAEQGAFYLRETAARLSKGTCFWSCAHPRLDEQPRLRRLADELWKENGKRELKWHARLDRIKERVRDGDPATDSMLGSDLTELKKLLKKEGITVSFRRKTDANRIECEFIGQENPGNYVT